MVNLYRFILTAVLCISMPAFGTFDVSSGRNSAGRTAYDVLGISPSASADDIKAARTKLVAMHPDRTGIATSTFQEMMTAYGLIKTADLREKYDQLIQGRGQSAQASGIRTEFLGDAVGTSALQQDLMRAIKKQYVGRGAFKVVRLDNLKDFAHESGFQFLDKALKYLFSNASVKFEHWNRIAASISDDEFTQKIYVVLVPAGARTLDTDVAGVLNHTDNMAFGTYYMADDILPEQGNSYERRSAQRMKYIKDNSEEFRGSHFLFVNPTGIEKMQQRLGRDISVSAIAHELTHIHDIDLLRRWVLRNLELHKSGKPVHPFFKQVGRIRDGYAYLSYSFYRALIESRGYAISRLIERRLDAENIEKYDRQVRKELDGYRSNLGQELPEILKKMELNFDQLGSELSDETFFRKLTEGSLGESSILQRIQAATVKADKDACWIYLDRVGKVLGKEGSR